MITTLPWITVNVFQNTQRNEEWGEGEGAEEEMRERESEKDTVACGLSRARSEILLETNYFSKLVRKLVPSDSLI